MAAIAMIVNPASPSAGRAASAMAVSPYSMTSGTVSVPKTPSEISTYSTVVTPSAPYIAFGSSRVGSRRSPAANVITLKPRYAKNVSATLAMMSEKDGYPLNASRSRSMSTSVTAMNTAKTPRRRKTISDWARSTTFVPTKLTKTIASTIAVVKTLSQIADASSPMNSEVA